MLFPLTHSQYNVKLEKLPVHVFNIVDGAQLFCSTRVKKRLECKFYSRCNLSTNCASEALYSCRTDGAQRFI